jgi:TRAP-type C4-dicarboxylate transport system substrate-binding protein
MKLGLTAIAAIVALAVPASAAELIYGNWTPAQEYQNRVAMPDVIKMIDAETKGAVKWKLIAGGQVADAKATIHGG